MNEAEHRQVMEAIEKARAETHAALRNYNALLRTGAHMDAAGASLCAALAKLDAARTAAEAHTHTVVTTYANAAAFFADTGKPDSAKSAHKAAATKGDASEPQAQ